jgi:hypothetical protein
MRRPGTLLVVVVVVVVGSTWLAGCGGSGDEESVPDTVADYVPPEGITIEEWRTQMTAVCEGFEARVATLANRPEPDDPDEAVALIGEILPIVDGYVADLSAVPVPAGRVRDLEQLQLDIEEYRGAIEQGRSAAAARDVNGVYAMLRELNRQGAVINGRLGDLGVTACTD